jgi:UDP-N-acetylglucosamine--N-acetylmuramyl-(pentapeptide) pyrophosphoryl-undecaprenol N-acetylglucosamine transferase
VPALAVAAELRAEGARVVFVGGQRAERRLVPEAGYELRTLTVEGLDRRNPLRAVRAAVRAARALAGARAILSELRPGAVLGAGGYVAGPVGAAAASRRIPLVLTEADSHLGLSNRLLARVARRVCLAFPIAGRDGPRYRVTGRPIPPGGGDRERGRASVGLDAEEQLVLVFGGSLGARSINLAAAAGLAGAEFHVLHVAGARDYPELAARELGERYHLREYLEIERFEDALAACDLVVARAGGSVFEIAAEGRPSVLIPYPHATSDHQTANARYMTDAGAAVIVADAELTAARLAREVGALLGDRGRLIAMGRAATGVARPRAARDVAEELLAAAETTR